MNIESTEEAIEKLEKRNIALERKCDARENQIIILNMTISKLTEDAKETEKIKKDNKILLKVIERLL